MLKNKRKKVMRLGMEVKKGHPKEDREIEEK